MTQIIDRETLIERSVQVFIEAALSQRGYSGLYDMLDAFEGAVVDLDKTKLAIGYNFDDGGAAGELGSDLRHRFYTIEFYVFGKTASQGRNLANTVKFALENGDQGDGTVPLLDFAQNADNPPEIDRLVVGSCHAQRVPIQDPEPWEQFAWITTVQIEDYYYAHTT